MKSILCILKYLINVLFMNVYNINIGMTSAAASIGAIFLWNVELGLTEIDKYLYIEDDNIKVYIKDIKFNYIII